MKRSGPSGRLASSIRSGEPQSHEEPVGAQGRSAAWTGHDGLGGTDLIVAVAYDTAVPARQDAAADSLPPTDGDPRRWMWLRVAGAVVMGLWCIGLVVYSTTIYYHDFLGEDFATYNQAWTLIGQGHLNPYDTIYHFPFIKSDFELIIWPLALVHLVYPGSVALLWIQDLAVAGSGFVVFLWIVDYLERRTVPWWPAAGVASVVLLVLIASPGSYQILYFDFHMEPISTVFVLLAGRDLWSGRHRRAWIWVVMALACGTFAAITLVGLGISALLAGREIPAPGGPGGRRRHRLVGSRLGSRRQRRIGHHHLRPPGRTTDADRPHRHRHPDLRPAPPSDPGHRPDPRPTDQHVRPDQTGRCGRTGLGLGIRSSRGGDDHQRLERQHRIDRPGVPERRGLPVRAARNGHGARMDCPAVPLRLDPRGRRGDRGDGAGPVLRRGVVARRYPLRDLPGRRSTGDPDQESPGPHTG